MPFSDINNIKHCALRNRKRTRINRWNKFKKDKRRTSNIPTSDKRIIIRTIKTGTKEEVILALMYILYIAKDFFDKFNP